MNLNNVTKLDNLIFKLISFNRYIKLGCDFTDKGFYVLSV